MDYYPIPVLPLLVAALWPSSTYVDYAVRRWNFYTISNVRFNHLGDPLLTSFAGNFISPGRPTISYSSNALFKLRRLSSKRKPDELTILRLKELRLFNYRGSRAGKYLQRTRNIRVTNRRRRHISQKLSITARHSVLIPAPLAFDLQTTKVTFGFLNAQSIGNKCSTILSTILDLKLDCFCLCETWHRTQDISLTQCTPSAFNCFDKPRASDLNPLRPNHGGVAVLCRNTYRVEKMLTDVLPETFELLTLKLNFSTSNDLTTFDNTDTTSSGQTDQSMRILLVTVYRPGSRRISARFFDEFTSLIESLLTFSTEFIMVADLNIHLDSPNDWSTMRMSAILDVFNLKQWVSESTHTGGHCLDVIITRHDTALNNVLVYPPQTISDHSLLTFNLTRTAKSNRPVTKRVRIWKNLVIEDFRTDLSLSELCSQEILGCSNVDTLALTYDRTLLNLLDKHVPLRDIPIMEKPGAPWFDGTCRDRRREVRAAERLYRRCIDPALKEGLKESFKIKSKALQSFYYKRKCDFWCLSFASSTDSRKLWRNFYSLCNKNNVVLPTPSSNNLAEFFKLKVEGVRAATSGARPAYYTERPHTTLISFRECTASEMKALILSLPSKSCSLDPVPTWLVKSLVDLLATFLAHLFNASLSSGTVPALFKAASVTPILKKPNLDNKLCENYRPISNLRYISKLLERVVFDQISQYLECFSLLPVNQSAYRKCHSTETALLNVFSDIVTACDSGRLSMLMLLDFSSAFDTVDHSVLLARLELTFGFSGVVLQWFNSYLSNRSQCVVVEGLKAEPTILTCGVPQGSVLGPLLFSLYTTDIPEIINQHQLSGHAFADDTQAYKSFTVHELDATIDQFSDCFSAIKQWADSNRLRLNPNKTEIIIFGSAHNLKKIELEAVSLDNSLIKISKSVRDLGFFFDSQLKLDAHLSHIITSSYFQLSQLWKVRKFLDNNTACTLAHSFITSRLDYCNSLLFGCSQNTINKLQSLQNNAARFVLKVGRYEHITDKLHSLHWLKVEQRIIYKVALLCYKCLHKQAPTYLSDRLESIENNRTSCLTRSVSRGDLMVPRQFTATYGNRAFDAAAPCVWNALPTHLRKPDLTIDSFKTGLKTHLFDVCYQ